MRILLVNESSFLETGYAKYGRNILERLHKDGYEVAELGIFSTDEEQRVSKVKWKFFPNGPGDPNYGKDSSDVYGKFAFENAICQFKPHIVFDLRDPFMYDFEYYSPLRDKYHWMIMAPVDGLPQQPQWLEIFKNADNVFTYTDWAKNILKEYQIDATTASPASSSCCYPLSRNKVAELKKKFNLENKKIVGTVMRNQPRKLFESLFAGFREYLSIAKDNDTLLYLHTSYPDVGYNLIKLTFEYQLASKVLITYICKHCKHYQPMFLSDIATFCPKCNNRSLKITDVYTSLKEEEMNEVYNLFDVYVQCASREGFGMPQVEAASCGIPIVSMPYAGMHDICDKITSHKIGIAGEKMNHSMHMYEAVPSISSIGKSIDKAMGTKYNNNVRKDFEKHYSSWDATYQIWKSAIDKVNIEEIEKKQQEKYIINPNFSVNQNLSNIDFARELILAFLGERYLGSYLHTRLIQDLSLGVAFGDLGYYIVNHFDHFHANTFNKEVAIQVFAKMAERNLFWRKVWNDRLSN